ncbi:MAG: flavodoxin domain-containing protein [Planctomycetes bacterium]|nr:flavodoxin domain-containing protein [Planctomycetota bacterium]
MAEVFKAAKVTKNVWWVGAIDWNMRNFHGYATDRGTTYNAYLVIADKVTLVDTVKAAFKDEMLARIRSVIGDCTKIDYIISNHSEMDHTGCLMDTIAAVKPEKVFASLMGVKGLSAHFHTDYPFSAVENGGELELGGARFSFLETRMLHWPDSMVAYLPAHKLLFSQDGFGMHLSSSERFADELNEAVLEQEAARYYANILLPYSALVGNLLAKIADLGIEIDILAPDHGPIWRREIETILNLYSKWAVQKPARKAVIVYDTMWHSTEKMALAIGEGLAEGGISVRMLSLGTARRSDVITEMLDAGALLVGSPTLNNQMFPTVADILCYMKGLKPKNLVGAAFGSYGWSGEGARQVADILQSMGVDLVGEPLAVQYVPDGRALAECRALGLEIASRLDKICS